MLPSLMIAAALAGDPEGGEARVIVVSGAISRGSYQAGELLFLMDHLKRENLDRVEAGLPETRLVAVGASAGSINGLIAVTDALAGGTRSANDPPETSLFFRAWVPEGFHRTPESLDRWPEGDEHYALIRTGFLDESIDGVEPLLDGDSAWSTPMRLAMTTARLAPDPGGLRREVNESFGFEIQAPPGEPLRVVPLRMRCAGEAPADPNAPLLCESSQATASPRTTASGEELRVSWTDAGQLIGISSAVPLAFEPREMDCDTYLAWSLWPKSACHINGSDDPVLMVDGGVFDGHPFRVADRVSGESHEDGPGRFFYLDPDYGVSGPESAELPAPEDRVTRFFAEVVPTARAQSVTQFFQDHPHLLERVDFLRTRTTPIGSYLGGFLAFYDQSFRVWDFYAGMHDGYRNLQDILLAREGLDCMDYDLGVWRAGSVPNPRCEVLLPALDRRAAPAFFAVHDLLTAIESGVLDGADWANVARFVDERFATLDPFDLRYAAFLRELGGAEKDYDPLVLLRDLRTLSLLHATRALDLEHREDYGFDWFASRLSSVMPCPSREGCAPFWFVPFDLGGSLPLEEKKPPSYALIRRLTRLAIDDPARLADSFTLRQDGSFSVLFRRRVNWQLAALHRNPVLGASPARRELLRVGRLVATGSNRLWYVGTGTPTVLDMPGAWGVEWDAYRVKPWSAFGRHLPMPWVYGGVRAFGNPAPWWPDGHPNAVLSARAGLVLLQVRPGAQRLWLFDAPITPVLGPLFPFTLETGVLVQGTWVRGGISENLLIQPLWILPNQPALGATVALEARLQVLNLVSVGGEWHPLSRGLDGRPDTPGFQPNPEVRVMVWFTRPGLVRPDPWGTDW